MYSLAKQVTKKIKKKRYFIYAGKSAFYWTTASQLRKRRQANLTGLFRPSPYLRFTGGTRASTHLSFNLTSLLPNKKNIKNNPQGCVGPGWRHYFFISLFFFNVRFWLTINSAHMYPRRNILAFRAGEETHALRWQASCQIVTLCLFALWQTTAVLHLFFRTFQEHHPPTSRSE